MADMFEVLEVIVADDAETRGDFWRAQPWVSIPAASGVRPPSYSNVSADLAGKRFGVPRMYINQDPAAGTGMTIGGSTGQQINTRASVIALWEAARQDLEAAGAEVVEVDFPVVTKYEGDREGEATIKARGLVSEAFLQSEIMDLSAWAWEDFLRANGDPALSSLLSVDGTTIFPAEPGALPDRYVGFEDNLATYPAHVRDHPYPAFTDIPHIGEGALGLELTRRIDLEDWMDGLSLDAVVFPALADVAAADMDVNEAAADLGWRNGVWVANGNLVIRHLGIPTVTVPMGTMTDTRMPVGLTFAGRAYDDSALLGLAAAFEVTAHRRTEPTRTPRLPPVAMRSI